MLDTRHDMTVTFPSGTDRKSGAIRYRSRKERQNSPPMIGTITAAPNKRTAASQDPPHSDTNGFVSLRASHSSPWPIHPHPGKVHEHSDRAGDPEIAERTQRAVSEFIVATPEGSKENGYDHDFDGYIHISRVGTQFFQAGSMSANVDKLFVMARKGEIPCKR